MKRLHVHRGKRDDRELVCRFEAPSRNDARDALDEILATALPDGYGFEEEHITSERSASGHGKGRRRKVVLVIRHNDGDADAVKPDSWRYVLGDVLDVE